MLGSVKITGPYINRQGQHRKPSAQGVIFKLKNLMKKMIINDDDHLKHLRSIGRIVFETMMLMKKNLKPGISVVELDGIGEKNLARYGARSAPRLVYDFPKHTCISINVEAAHGIPSGQKLNQATS